MLITASVMLASLLYSIDWTIAVVALPHMQGHFTATQDQISWVITSYIVASAIMIPTGGWLSTRFGRKRVFVTALGGFTFASVLCGSADSLAFEVMSRVVQGMCGAFLIPLSHSIILDTYPPEEHAKAMALWGTGSVFGSVIGPTIGGFVTENMSWRYIFYINVPFGLIALLGALAFLPETRRDPQRRLDWFGFVSLAVGIGSFQMMLDRGQRLDWFESPEILTEAALACLGFYLFNVHCLTARAPFLDPRLFFQRKFFLSLVFVSFYGFLTLPTMVLMPTFLENLQGYPIDSIGMLQSPRGVGMLCTLFISSRIAGRLDPRILIAVALLTLGISCAEMSTWTAEVPAWPVIWTGLLQGVGAGLMLVPIQMISFPSLPPEQRTEAASVYNTVRSLCSSMGVSVVLALFVNTTTTARARLAEYVSPYSSALRAAQANGTWGMETTQQLAQLARELDRQAAMAGYNHAFLFLAAATLSALPLLLLVGSTAKVDSTATDNVVLE